MEEKIEVRRTAPIWCMDWTPITPDDQENILVCGIWDQTLTYYNANGQQLGSDRRLGFDPLSIAFH